ncbi:MAG: pYEATS domain-containing protein [Candidatus Acidiferrum sp.]
MGEPQIQPHRITKPIQLLAVWMAGLIILVGSFLAGARLLTEPYWLPPVLAISAVSLVPLFLGLLFLLQTKFRPQLQEDVYYSVWLARQTKLFEDFTPENLQGGQTTPSLEVPLSLSTNPKFPGVENIEQVRVGRYKKYQGVFLVHSWRPSRQRGQAADIVLVLQQHGDGPLKAGQVDRVEYSLGPKFFRGTVVKRNREECFRLEVSAYAPMLCVARVHLKDGSSFDLERYADFAWDVAFAQALSGISGIGERPAKRRSWLSVATR